MVEVARAHITDQRSFEVGSSKLSKGGRRTNSARERRASPNKSAKSNKSI